MAKQKTVYICQSCGAEFPKWSGQCAQCGEWNTLTETTVSARSSKSHPPAGGPSSKGVRGQIQKLGEVRSDFKRIETGIFEFDRVLGGGIVPGSINLLAGEPGIGKSTLLLQLASALTSEVLYICGEESPEQIKSRATRLDIEGEQLVLLPETDVDVISSAVSNLISEQRHPDGGKRSAVELVIIDSVQTLTTEDLSGGAGSIGQVRECSERLRRLSKDYGVPIVLVGHVTKSGSVAGPKVLEHLVDGVFTLEGDKFHEFRMLRAAKNRFGSSYEVGVFKMSGSGMEEVKNPSALFLSERDDSAPGSVVLAAMEGTRPVLVEVQALAVPSKFKYPRRSSSGVRSKRLELICAVLEKRTKLDLRGQDVYVNVASGVKVYEPAADLGIVLALASAVENKALDPDYIKAGEAKFSAKELQWSKTYGGSSADAGRAVCKTSDGGYLITGYTFGPDNIDTDILVIKTDSEGELIWKKVLGDAGMDFGNDCCPTRNGYLIVGYTISAENGKRDIIIIKIDNYGNVKWEETFGGTENDVGVAVASTPEDHYYIGGLTFSSEKGEESIYIIKISISGKELWSRIYGGKRMDRTQSISVSGDGGLIIGATSLSFGGSNSDFYILKINSSGDSIWAHNFNAPGKWGHGFDRCQDLSFASDEGYLLTGYSDCNDMMDAVVVKTDKQGRKEWIRTIGKNPFYDYGNSIIESSSGNYIIAGVTKTISRKNRLYDNDIFINEIDTQGNVMRNIQIIGNENDWVADICSTEDGSLIIVGHTHSTENGSRDVCLLKIK